MKLLMDTHAFLFDNLRNSVSMSLLMRFSTAGSPDTKSSCCRWICLTHSRFVVSRTITQTRSIAC